MRRLPGKVFFAIGDKENGGDFKMISDLNTYVSDLKKENYKGLDLKYMILPNDNHDMIFPGAFTQGIVYIYSKSSG